MTDAGPVLESRGGIVQLRGELDLAALPILCSTVRAAVAARPRAGVALDMAAVSFVDCAAIGALLELRREAHRVGVAFTLLSVPALVERVLSLLRLDGVFRVEDFAGRRRA